MAPDLLEILRCPACRGTLDPQPDAARLETLTCTACGRVYPVRDGVPVLLVDEATGGPASTEQAAGGEAGGTASS